MTFTVTIAYCVCLSLVKEQRCIPTFFVAGISVILVAAKEDTFRDADTEVALLNSLHPAWSQCCIVLPYMGTICRLSQSITMSQNITTSLNITMSLNITNTVGNNLFLKDKEHVQVSQHI